MDQRPSDPSSTASAESRLRDAEHLRRAFLDSALDAVLLMDQQGRVTEFNLAAERMFGTPRHAALGQELATLIMPPALRERHRRGLARYLATGDGALLGKRSETTAMRADGHEFPVEIYVTRLDLDGRPAFVGCVRDRTEHVVATREKAQIEEQLRQAQTLEAAGRLAGSVANEVNTLLTVISGRSHMVLGRLSEGSPLRREIEIIEKTAQRAVALIKQSGGDIELESELGRGTTLTVLLPRAGEAAEPGPPPALPEGVPGGSETVLLAEDEDEVRETMAEFLGKAGYTVISAMNGTQALELARRYKGPLHVLVTDLAMPKMNGRELARRLKLLRPDIKVLYVSGFVRDEAARAAIAGEDASFLPKPFTPTALIAAVSGLLVSRPNPRA